METPETEQPDVPVEQWVQTPVSDSADYLDREPPQYVESNEEEESDGGAA